MEDFECKFNFNEEDTVKNCSNIHIKTIFKKEIARGAYGVVFPASAKIKNRNVDIIIKKIISKFKTKKDKEQIINSMYLEANYTGLMGKHGIGPLLYDAFYYEHKGVLYQYLLMQKFDTSVANWLLSDSKALTAKNCETVSLKMINLLYKQIFVLSMYCADIKVDNFVMNENPYMLRMIDFGIEWCNKSRLPRSYEKIKSIRHHSLTEKKTIYFCLCMIQLFINIVHIGTSIEVLKMVLRPFYKVDIFINTLENGDIGNILLDILDNKNEQAIVLKHYLKETDNQSNEKIVSYVFNTLDQMYLKIFSRK